MRIASTTLHDPKRTLSLNSVKDRLEGNCVPGVLAGGRRVYSERQQLPIGWTYAPVQGGETSSHLSRNLCEMGVRVGPQNETTARTV